MSEVQEAYKVMQKASGIKVGDTVKALRQFELLEMGHTGSSSGSKENGYKRDFINHSAVGVVTEIEDNYIIVNCGRKYQGHWCFPFFVLEVIEKAKAETMIMVGGKEYSEATLQKAMQEYSK